MTSRSDRVDQEAAEWVVRLSEPDEADRKTKRQFLRWLLLSPEHKKAFMDTENIAYALGNLDRSRRIDVQALIRRGSPKIIPLCPAAPPDSRAGFSLRRWLRNRPVVLVLLVFVVSLLTPPGSAAAESPGQAQDASFPRTIYLVRHGIYEYQEGVDPDRGLPLIPLGIAQAKLVAARLRGMPATFDSLTASTMTRARETALVIGEQFPALTLETTPLLRECTPPTLPRPGKDGGVNKETTDCQQQLDDAFKTYFVPAKGAEKRDLLVCHGNVIRYFVTKALGVDTRAWVGMGVANASLTVIRVTPTGSFQVLSVGDVGHLPPSLLTGWSTHDPQLTVPHSTTP